MSLPHFFLSEQILSEQTDDVFELALDANDRSHIRALRLHAGEHVAVIDAGMDYFECEIVSNNDDRVFVSISQHLDVPSPAFSVTLIQGIAKGEKMDEVIRHATELGVDAFIPFASARSVVKLDEKKTKTRLDRWRNIAKSAAQQSGQVRIPVVSPPCGIAELIAMLDEFDVIVIFWEEAHDTNTLKDILSGASCSPYAKVALIVGAEGGLTEDEVSSILNANTHAHLASLGSSILRTETAGVVGSALVIYELGGLGAQAGGSSCNESDPAL